MICDEAAIIPNNIADQFFASVYPVISSGTKTKILVTSTPLGYNHFWKLWKDAESGKNGFIPFSVNYWEIPGRDEAWAEEQRKVLGELKFNQEVLCLGGEAVVTIRDPKTNTTEDIRLEDLYQKVSDYDSLEILTPSGFQPFEGIIRRRDHALEIRTTTTTIRSSFTHRFIVGEKEIEAQWLRVGDTLSPTEEIVSIEYAGEIDLYDPVNVGTDHVYLANGLAHHNCHFLGSSKTLISGHIIAQLAAQDPIHTNEQFTLKVYKAPEKGRSYVVIADVARGVGGDHSVATVVDVTETPYEIVAVFRDNTISPMLFPDVIHRLAKDYLDAYVLIETNDIGGQVADILYADLQYENIFSTTSENGRAFLTPGFNGGGIFGIRTTKSVKRIGCSAIKNIVEERKLLINDPETIHEMSTFIEKAGSFQADEGYHDDIMMTLVLFGWMTTNTYFKDLTNVDIRTRLYQQKMQDIELDLTPFGFVDDGIMEERFIQDNVIWSNSNDPIPWKDELDHWND